MLPRRTEYVAMSVSSRRSLRVRQRGYDNRHVVAGGAQLAVVARPRAVRVDGPGSTSGFGAKVLALRRTVTLT